MVLHLKVEHADFDVAMEIDTVIQSDLKEDPVCKVI